MLNPARKREELGKIDSLKLFNTSMVTAEAGISFRGPEAVGSSVEAVCTSAGLFDPQTSAGDERSEGLPVTRS